MSDPLYKLPERVHEAIEFEREYQKQMWGESPHDVGAWLSILRVELREAEGAWRGQHGDRGALCEILQVVAVGVACLEEHGVIIRHQL